MNITRKQRVIIATKKFILYLIDRLIGKKEQQSIFNPHEPSNCNSI